MRHLALLPFALACTDPLDGYTCQAGTPISVEAGPCDPYENCCRPRRIEGEICDLWLTEDGEIYDNTGDIQRAICPDSGEL